MALCTLHPPREGEKQLWSQVIAMAASDWSNHLLLSNSCSCWGLQADEGWLMGRLILCTLQYSCPGMSTLLLCDLCFPHISTLLSYSYQTLRGSHVLCSDLVPPRQECSALWTSSYLSLTISLKECHNWRVVGGGGVLGHCFLDFCKSHMHIFLRRFEFKISKRH